MEVIELIKSGIDAVKIGWEFSKLIIVPEFIPALLVSSFFFLEKTPLKEKRFIKKKWGKFWFVLCLATIYALLFSLSNLENTRTLSQFIDYQIKLFTSYFVTLIIYHSLAKYIINKYFIEEAK
jgi:hypothetical protein